MRKLLVAAAAAVFSVACLLSPVSAQQPAGPPSGVAIIDINYLIKENPHLKAMMAEMKRDVARAEEALNKERDAIRQLSEQIKEHKAGTLQYKQIEEDVTKRSTDFNVKVTLQRKEFLQQESKIYFQVYQEIWQEVDYVAAANSIALVLKTSNEPVDTEKPDEILREMNKQIIWHSKGLDITRIIHERLMQRYGQGQAGGGPATANARQGVPPVQR